MLVNFGNMGTPTGDEAQGEVPTLTPGDEMRMIATQWAKAFDVGEQA